MAATNKCLAQSNKSPRVPDATKKAEKPYRQRGAISRAANGKTRYGSALLVSTALVAATRSGKPCRSPATKKGRCRLHGGASGSGGPPGERNGQYRHGERTKAAIAEQQKFSALLKMLRAGLT
jgi:hypothetical protein